MIFFLRDSLAPRFYCPFPLRVGASIELPQAAAHHALRVLRLRPSDRVTLFNGEGGEYHGTIAKGASRSMLVQIDTHHDIEREARLKVTLIQGLTSVEKMDYTFQKATELGVSAIQPVATVRSVVRLDAERAAKKLAHWRQVVASACEQSQRNRVPGVLGVVQLSQWLAKRGGARGLMLMPGATVTLDQIELPTLPIDLLIGPEGGLSEDERALAQRSGFVPVSMGPRILRTETAALAALSAMNMLWGDFRRPP